MGPLKGIRVIEIGGIGAAPFCCMLLADMGADVLRVDRLSEADLGMKVSPRLDLLNRNKRSVAIDLKNPEGIRMVLNLVRKADVLIESFRPGVTEKLGLGPEDCWKMNPRLIYGRMTGWGQEGPLSRAAGHDLNYIALVGILAAIGRKEASPSIPLNLIGDFGGGALYMAMGVLAALIESRVSNKGQVVDAAMIDGAANMMTMIYSWKAMNAWKVGRESNMIDGGSPFYNVYETKDGRYIAIAAFEKRFYQKLIELIGLGEESLPDQNNPKKWDELKTRFSEVFKTRTRDDWCKILEGSDACFAPVLDMEECVTHPHVVARKMFVEADGIINPAPAPRFGRTKSELYRLPPGPGENNEDALKAWGFSNTEIQTLKTNSVIG